MTVVLFALWGLWAGLHERLGRVCRLTDSAATGCAAALAGRRGCGSSRGASLALAGSGNGGDTPRSAPGVFGVGPAASPCSGSRPSSRSCRPDSCPLARSAARGVRARSRQWRVSRDRRPARGPRRSRTRSRGLAGRGGPGAWPAPRPRGAASGLDLDRPSRRLARARPARAAAKHDLPRPGAAAQRPGRAWLVSGNGRSVPRCARRAEPQQVLRECPMTPLRVPSQGGGCGVSSCDRGREHGFGALRLPALRFVRTASGSARPRPRLQRHAPRLGGFTRYRGAPRSPRGHKNPRGSRLAVRSSEPPSVSMWLIVPVAGRLPAEHRDCGDSGTVRLSGAHVGVSRPRCRWQLCGWRHPTTPSREPHERSS